MMISVDEALELILKHTTWNKSVRKKLSTLQNDVLAADVRSPIDSPPFDQSSMDGYAVRFKDLSRQEAFELEGENSAGQSSAPVLSDGKAIRVFTGALVPKRADTIIVQENVQVQGNRITIMDKSSVSPNTFIRIKGQQIKKNKVALPKGHLMTPASIGYLASLGIEKVKVIAGPRIGLVTTGNELQVPGKKLKAAQIYESNSYTLEALLRQMGFDKPKRIHITDDVKKLVPGLARCIRNHDVTIITGGVSVGDYDFVVPVLAGLGVNEIFHYVAQKPGRPFYFGVKGKKLIFALPGNPASVMVCFYEYIYPALRKMCGFSEIQLPSATVKCLTSYSKKPTLTHFLKGLTHGDAVEILSAQESFALSTFAMADCLVVIPEKSEGVKENDPVLIHYLHRQ